MRTLGWMLILAAIAVFVVGVLQSGMAVLDLYGELLADPMTETTAETEAGGLAGHVLAIAIRTAAMGLPMLIVGMVLRHIGRNRSLVGKRS